ncbi:tyrosine-type recombinase/integrase [Brumicola pallidula]|uniref:Probable tyrosine recombinase xerC-like n=1 Tax=Brumicola pallidula DSM 14239 = ACAM 615 TaxID=1121922 RepID=K7A3V3_9ALTE|nr:site-specific integrase [Glaciecola pallidula]GAC30170.1 probable tyrosine recombinase xerC-like [Glaciecola pallidula DSM 14239 = ACAM 615]
MTQPVKAISPLRQRMIDDMNMRKLSPKTQIGYLRAVTKLGKYLKRSPAHATVEEVRQFQIALVEQGTSNNTINSTLIGLKFVFCKTLKRPEVLENLSCVPIPRKLPEILSLEEVKRLIEAAHNLKYRTALSVAYGAGLRISEVVDLEVSDIDSQWMALRIEQGKGSQDRLAMLSPVLLGYLRDWWRYAQEQRLMLNGGWLFPGQQPFNHISTRQLSRACKAAAHEAKIERKISMHTLRRSYATHLLEAKVDIRVIQTLLGHRQLETTALYAQVATKLLHEVASPLDALKLKP